MAKEMEHEIKQTNGGKVLARLWVEDDKVKADPPSYLEDLRHVVVMGKSLKDGVDFLEQLPFYYKSGYTTCRRVN